MYSSSTFLSINIQKLQR